MVWPFSHKDEDNLLPQLGGTMHQPVDLGPEARIRALEQRCAQLEWGIRELCNAIAIMQDTQNHNYASMGTMFNKLVAYVMRPSKSIMGEQQDKN